jgi:hypothetical protein
MNPIPIIRSEDPRRLPLEGIILVAHQPECFPYLGNISKATMGDVYFLLDTVQFVKEHWQNKNRIRISGGQGWQWLSVPVKGVKKHFIQTDKVEIDGDFWKKKHLKAIQLSYQRTPYFDEIFSEISAIYSNEHVLLVDFLLDIIYFAFRKFNINIPVYRTSELIKLGYIIEGKKSDLVINMCRVVDADVFVFGRDGRTYIDKEVFLNNRIKFVFQEYLHPVYSQMHGEFLSHMSFFDLLFNYGPNAIKILGKSTYLEE